MSYFATDSKPGIPAAPSRRPKSAYPRFSGEAAGRRCYNPVLGKWASRDPIGEFGGVNLYQFAINNAVDQFDSLGLDTSTFTDRPFHETVFWALKIEFVLTLRCAKGDAPGPSDMLVDQIIWGYKSLKRRGSQVEWAPKPVSSTVINVISAFHLHPEPIIKDRVIVGYKVGVSMDAQATYKCPCPDDLLRWVQVVTTNDKYLGYDGPTKYPVDEPRFIPVEPKYQPIPSGPDELLPLVM